MAHLPPKPPRWRRRGLLIAGAVLIIGALVALWHWFRRYLMPAVLADGTVDANTWVGFVGNIIAALLGGLAAVAVLRLTLRHERSKAQAEEHRQVVERRLDLADELGDLVGTLNVGVGLSIPEITLKSLQASRLVRKIDRTWADQHEGRHISIPLFSATTAFREVVDDGLFDPALKWLGEELFPAIESLTGAMVHRDSSLVSANAQRLLEVVETKPKRPE